MEADAVAWLSFLMQGVVAKPWDSTQDEFPASPPLAHYGDGGLPRRLRWDRQGQREPP
jgi:hypothetical protein